MTNGNGLPENWSQVNVRDIAESIQYGYTESSSNSEVGPKFLRITDIQDNRVDWKSVPYCKIDDEKRDRYRLKDGDLVFARTGATVGKSFLIKGEIPDAVFASYLIRLRFPKTVLDKFVYYFFQSHLYWKQIVDGQVGIGQPNVNGTKLGELELPLAPTKEQEQIVAKIEELFSELDAGVQSLKHAQAQLKTYRQSVLKWAFEGRLTNDDVKDNDLANGWSTVTMGEIVEPPKYGTSKKCGYQSKGIGVLRIPNIAAGAIDAGDLKFAEFDKDEIEAYTLQYGDLLTIRSNGSVDLVGKCAMVSKNDEQFLFAGYLIRLRPKDNAVHPKFLLHVLSSKELRIQIESKAKSTSGVNNINSKELQSLLIPYCSIDEQVRVVDEIERRLSVCDKLEESIETSLEQSEALRQSILKQAFEGKLVPQD